MKRRVWKLLLPLIIAPVLLLAGLQWWVSARFTTQEIVKRLEAEWNCRVTAGSVSVRMFAFPARVELRDLRLVPREESKKPATPGETFILLDQVLLELNVWSLVTGKLEVKRALIDGLAMQTAKWADGGNSLRLLLAPPGTEARPAVQPVTLEDTDEIPAPDAGAGGDDGKPFHISELPITSTLREARIRNASWTILNHRKNTTQQFKDGNFVLTGMTLDPGNPAIGGTASVSAAVRLIIDSQQLKLRTIDFIIGLEGKYQLVDPVTGNLNNDLEFHVTVKKGSLVNRIPTLVKLNERLEKLKAGIGLSLEVPPEATLTADTILRARLKDGVIRFTDEVFFPFDTYQIALDKDSWLSLRDEQHEFTGRLIASGPVSRNAVTGLREFLQKRSDPLAELISKTLLDRIVNAAGNIELPFKSTAQIGRPDVKLSEKFMDALKRAGTEAGKDLLKDAIEGGDDLNSIIDAFKDLRKKDK